MLSVVGREDENESRLSELSAELLADSTGGCDTGMRGRLLYD